MELIVHVLVLGFAGIIVLSVVVFVVIDMFGRVDYLKDKVPWLQRILERREALGVLLIVAVFLLIGDGYELLIKDIPEVPKPPIIEIKVPPPPAIRMQVVSVPKEPADSLRRRSLRLADEMEAFLTDRWNNQWPKFRSANLRGDVTQDQLMQQFGIETENLYVANGLRTRTMGILSELKGKGLDTGYLATPNVAPIRPLGGTDLEQVRCLAYHLDGQDRVVRFYP